MFLWPEDEPLSALPPGEGIEGRVVGFSDSGLEPCVFAVVEVVRTQTVIVPVNEVEAIEAKG